MISLAERLTTFAQLGNYLQNPAHADELARIAQRAYHQNNWFTPANSLQALSAISHEFLSAENLNTWVEAYGANANFEPAQPKTIGVVMAGNIPAVGFHDLLSVLISGHRLLAKISSQDLVLIQYLIQKLKDLNPAFSDYIEIADRLNRADAYIATGSTNSSRYFEQYFASKPHIIRRNRSSVGVLMGDETPDEFRKLGHDISDYYGLGCRNISTLLVPEGVHGQPYDFIPLLGALEDAGADLMEHHKYKNNYDYNKSIYLINGVPHYDNGSLLVTENEALVSPISVVYYHTYSTQDDVGQWLADRAGRIQAVASAQGWYAGSVAFGQTQRPTLTDYADGVDTLAFLQSLA